MQYTIIRSGRRTLALQICEGKVIVRAPYRVDPATVEAFVISHRDWIEKQLKKNQQARRAFEDVKPLCREELAQLAKEAAQVIPERVKYYAERLGVSYGRITIRNQRTRWGSCTAKGNLNFNCLLMLTPSFCLDYVVVHELCHRLEMNHSPAFWAQVERVLPDYRESREWLKEHEKELIGRL